MLLENTYKDWWGQQSAKEPAKEYPFNHASVDNMKECVDSVCDQGVVNTVSVGAEGHCNSLNMKCEVFNTSTVTQR